MKSVFTFIIVILFMHISFCQKAKLEGVFVDSAHMPQLIRVQLLKDTEVISQTLASPNGKYSFNNLDSGSYGLRFIREGERDITEQNIILHKGKVTEIVIEIVTEVNECPYRYPKNYKPKCPIDGKDKIIPIVYGFPVKKALEKAKKGKIYLGGCVVSNCDPLYYCPRHKLEL